MDSTIIAALIAVVGALAGAWAGAAISRNASARATESANKNAINIMREEEHNRAAAKLRAAFAPAQARISLIDPDRGHPVCNILRELIPSHAAAIEEFRPFVPESDRIKYQEAWEDYYETILQGAPYATGKAWEREKTIVSLFEEKIHTVLAFAEK